VKGPHLAWAPGRVAEYVATSPAPTFTCTAHLHFLIELLDTLADGVQLLLQPLGLRPEKLHLLLAFRSTPVDHRIVTAQPTRSARTTTVMWHRRVSQEPPDCGPAGATGLTTVRGRGHVHRLADPVPRSCGACPNVGDRSQGAVCSPGTRPDTPHDTGRSQRTERCMDCTIPVPHRSLDPSRPVRFHQILAFHSPPCSLTRSQIQHPCFRTML